MNNPRVTKTIRVIVCFLFFGLLAAPAAWADQQALFDENFYHDLFHNHGIVMLVIEPESGAIIHANHAAANFYGYTVNELETMSIQQINTLSPEKIAKERMAAFNEERNYFIFPNRLASGDVRTVEVESYPISNNEQVLLFSIVTDITERAAMENELLARQQSNNIMAILAIIGLLVSTLALLRLNRQRKKTLQMLTERQTFQEIITGLSAELMQTPSNAIDPIIKNTIRRCGEELGAERSLWIRFSPDEKTASIIDELSVSKVPSLQEQHTIFELDSSPWIKQQIFSNQMVQIDDTQKLPSEAAQDQQLLHTLQIQSMLLFPVSVNNRITGCWGFQSLSKKHKWQDKPLPMLQVIAKIFEIAIERQYSDQKMETWHRLTQYIIEHSPSAIAVHDKDLNYMFVSNRYIKEYRLNEVNLIGKHHYEVFPDLPEKWRQVHRRVLEGAVESAEDDPYLRADGTIDYTRWNARPWYDIDGSIGGLIIYTEVINERKNQELALKESEERFRLLVETAPDAIFLYVGRVLAYVNQAAVALVGAVEPEDIIGTQVMHWLHPDFCKVVEERYKVLLEEKKAVPPMEQIYVRSDGRTVDVEVSAVPIQYDENAGALVYVRNITERKAAERERLEIIRQKRQQQKLESIGTLASGVAHEINNPIMGIFNYAQLILDSTEPEGDCAEYAREIVLESHRISDIVKSLLYFSRQEKQSHSKADMEDIIKRTLSLVIAVLKKDQIEIKLEIPENLPQVKCRSQQIQQVLMNLLTNARDALNEKYQEHHDDKIIRIIVTMYEEKGRKWIRLTVEDHGNGIPEEVQERIYDPFFTTKPKEIGTGLGLPISYGIVQEHHGELTFETKLGEYTRFHLILPVENGWELE